MRINMPVTNNEYVLTESDTIVSKTTLSGVITYINADFMRISGYSEQELIGQPQNIVRHPDMPVEAFADFWNCMKADKAWTGVVKNRCKNGDYYWVLANSTPIRESGQTVGYMSVRTKAPHSLVEETAKVYRMFKDGKAGNLKIENGQAVKSGLLSKLNPFRNASIKSRLLIVMSALSVLLVAIGGLGLFGMSKSNEGLRTVYVDRTIALAQISDVDTLMSANRIAINNAALFPTDENINRRSKIVADNSAQINKIWAEYMASYFTPEEQVLADKFAADRTRFQSEGIDPAMSLLRAKKIDEARELIRTRFGPLADPVVEGVAALTRLQGEIAKSEYENSVSRYETIRLVALAVMVLGLLIAVWLGASIISAIVKPLQRVRGYFDQISQGNYRNNIEIENRDEIGDVLDSLKAMQIRQGFDIVEGRRVADEATRIKIGLDNVSTGVLIADNDQRIIYMNNAISKLFKTTESNIRKDLPNFNATSLIGGSAASFNKDPAHQKSLLATLSATHREQLVLGGHTFAVATSPVMNDKNQRLGSVAEWNDRTVEVATEQEVDQIVKGAVAGNFTNRMDMTGKEGFFKALGEGINNLMQTSETGLDEVVRMLSALARGDLTDKITNEYEGTFGQLKDDANTTTDKLKDIVGQIKVATDKINTASREIAAGNANLSQRTEEQASSLEETASSMEELTSTVKQNEESARQANRLAKGASDIAMKGGAVVGKVVETMSDINNSSRKIVDIISVIDGIAFQTNILALNAAVEAARAGEQGRGFAVVATEVRNLAQRSAAAAKEIKTLIGDSVEKVEGGAKLVDEAGKTMEEIVSAVKRVTDIMSEIAAASTEQSAGIEQVNTAITQMDEVTQQNAALVEQAAAAAESMEEEAQNLAQYVGVFKLDESLGTDMRRLAAPRKPDIVAKLIANRHAPATTAKGSIVKPKPIAAKKTVEEEWEEY